MNEMDKRKLYAALSAAFPESCIQRTEGRLTGRGYDTTGIGYQHIVNRLNEVLGVGGFRTHRTVTVKEVKRSNGRPAFEAICDLTLELGQWVEGKFVVFAESLADGGHVSSSEADARKGAYTNAFKKAAAFHGVGKAAYEGSLDDDNLPTEGEETSGLPAMTSRAAPQTTGPTVIARPAPAPAPAAQTRSRLSSKQLGMVWGLARKLGFEQSTFRGQVKQEFGAALEFLTRDQASQLITRLTQKASNGNGHAHHANGELKQPPAGMES